LKLIADKKHYNQPVNLEKVAGIFLSEKPTKSGKYYIKFSFCNSNSDVFWLYDTLQERNFVFDNYILPLIEVLGS